MAGDLAPSDGWQTPLQKARSFLFPPCLSLEGSSALPFWLTSTVSWLSIWVARAEAPEIIQTSRKQLYVASLHPLGLPFSSHCCSNQCHIPCLGCPALCLLSALALLWLHVLGGDSCRSPQHSGMHGTTLADIGWRLVDNFEVQHMRLFRQSLQDQAQ